MDKLAGRTQIVLVLFVILVASLLLVTIPAWLLDFLLALNIGFSLLLLLVGLYIPNAVALRGFPALLLLTTLFRLGLNVASTRLILLSGFAGNVIQSFGEFLIRGEVVVGAIIFLIITIVNFIVVARGAGRVAEVVARFTLDALPGRQMAIDADLRAGSITADQARDRRVELKREADLFGAMDGAMKFVQGDAVAGLIIIVTNVLGGIYVGMSHGLDFQTAVQTYTLLTVGDGLVAQIPALLISICAGIVVTRVSDGEGSSLSLELGKQLFGKFETLALGGVVVFLIGVLPGLPVAPFWTVAAFFFIGSYFVYRRRKAERTLLSKQALKSDSEGFEYLPEHMGSILLYLDQEVLYKLYAINLERYQRWIREYAEDCQRVTGLRLPNIIILPNADLEAMCFEIKLGNSLLASEKLLLDSVLVDVHPCSAPVFGVQVLKEVTHPLSMAHVFWTALSPRLLKLLQAGEIKSYDFLQYAVMRVAAFCLNNPEEIIRFSDVSKRLKELERRHPELIQDVVGKGVLSAAQLTELLQELVRQAVPIDDLRQILESAASYQAMRQEGEDFFSLSDIVEYIRLNRRRALVANSLGNRLTLKVIELAPELEEIFEEIAPDSLGPKFKTPNHPKFPALSASFKQLTSSIFSRGLPPVVVVCRSDLRAVVFKFLSSYCGFSQILGSDEISNEVSKERMAIWNIAS